MKLLVLICLLGVSQTAFFQEPRYDKRDHFNRHSLPVTEAAGLANVKPECDPCPSGFGFESCGANHHTVCKLCKAGTFAGPTHHYEKCKSCSQCGPGLYAKSSCHLNMDTVCASCIELTPMINHDYINQCLSRDNSRDWPSHLRTSTSSYDKADPLKNERLAFENVLEEKIQSTMTHHDLLDKIFNENFEVDKNEIDAWIAEREADTDVQMIIDKDFYDAHSIYNDKKSSESKSISEEEDEWYNWWNEQTNEMQKPEKEHIHSVTYHRADNSERIMARVKKLIHMLMATKVLLLSVCVMTALALCFCICRVHNRRSAPKTRVILSPPSLYNPLKSNEVPYSRLNEVEAGAVRSSALAQCQTHKFVQSDDEYEDDEYLYQPVHTVVNPLDQLTNNGTAQK